MTQKVSLENNYINIVLCIIVLVAIVIIMFSN